MHRPEEIAMSPALPSALSLRLPALAWCAAALLMPGVAAASFQSSAALSALRGTSGAFSLSCVPASCFQSQFSDAPGTVSAATASYTTGGFTMSGWAESWAESLLLLHAGSSLSVTAPATAAAGETWSAIATAGFSTTLEVSADTVIDTSGGLVMTLRYRLDGTQALTLSDGATGVASGGVFATAFGFMSVPCRAVAGSPGDCEVAIGGVSLDRPLPYELLLQTVARVIAPAAGGAYSGTAEADYRSTLTWTGASLSRAGSGEALTGWSLYAGGSAVPVFSSPVPEVPALPLMVAGLAAMGVAARRRR